MKAQSRILVVDDEKSLNLAIRRMLEEEGYLVECAFDGMEALQKVGSFQPKAIILDVMMPKENGYRVSRAIKTLGPHARCFKLPKVILVTARNMEHDPDREETLNRFSLADAVLYKPVKFSDLLQKLRSLIEE